LDDRALAPLAITLHELATNAVKYGALSFSDGHVEISWKLDSSSIALFGAREAVLHRIPRPRTDLTPRFRSSIVSQADDNAVWPKTGLEARISFRTMPC
jgi:two-component sensor histidine kinase